MQENTLINGAFEVVETINVEKLISNYKKDYNIDVSYLFEGLKQLEIVKCKQTGFRFYYPLTVEGDNKFYNNLYSNNDERLYLKTKWEFLQAAELIKPNSVVLDVGCGGGDFFDLLKEKNCKCFGIDKSNFAVDLLKSKGVEFSDEP
ncbi:MAG: methyltransferase domain-containing protein, partial [Bacteroidia bacterium]|nr:methyltransferase domain-containing protein [Bacteroidia bacterium]